MNASSLIGGPLGYQTPDRVGALFTFSPNTSTIMSRIGGSWRSVDRACQVRSALPSWDVKETAKHAVEAWDNEVLSKIEISDTSNRTLLVMFYSALYRTALLPSNRTGENPFWDDGVGYVDDIC